jgi:hypothetical protein
MPLKRRWFARLPGGGESRDIWKLGPLCTKRWSLRVSPTEVRIRCRLRRDIPICNRLWYVPWFHWTVSLWRDGKPATYDACNWLLVKYPVLADLHPANVIVTKRRLVAIDFALNSPLEAMRTVLAYGRTSGPVLSAHLRSPIAAPPLG